MHLREPCPPKPPTHRLPESEEHKHHAVICCQNTAEDPCKDTNVAILRDPVDNREPKAERYGLFANVHRNQHLRYVGIVRVNRISESVCQVEEGPYCETSWSVIIRSHSQTWSLRPLLDTYRIGRCRPQRQGQSSAVAALPRIRTGSATQVTRRAR